MVEDTSFHKDEGAITLVSDGGAREGGVSGACVVKHQTLGRFKLLYLFTDVDNTEAELLAGTFGLAFISARFTLERPQVTWWCDNQGILSVAAQKTRPDRARLHHLWQAFAHFESQVTLQGKYIRGHSGDRVHDSCDKACRWASLKGPMLLSAHGEGYIGRNATERPGQAWYLLDARALNKSQSVDQMLSTITEINARYEQ